MNVLSISLFHLFECEIIVIKYILVVLSGVVIIISLLDHIKSSFHNRREKCFYTNSIMEDSDASDEMADEVNGFVEKKLPTETEPNQGSKTFLPILTCYA